MPSHPIDFEINRGVFCTPELSEIFDERARYQRWLDFEAALAGAQAEMGIIPQEAAQEIARKARLEHLDLEGVHKAYWQSRNSLTPLLGGLRKACANGHGEYVHYGATTQDVLDTAEVLELREAMAIIYRDLRALEQVCLDLTKVHRATPIAARTHGQQALPTTFGLKVAIWLAEIRRHVERLKHVSEGLVFGQLGGAVGTMAALGPDGPEVARRTIALLGLKTSTIAWHNSRDRIGELASLLCLIASTLEKMANEIFQLQKTEIGELAEPSPRKAASSSTMPHKRNPAICERTSVLSRHVRHLTGCIMESIAHEHERDARCLWSEWLAMPQICIYTGTALAYMLDTVSGLEVRAGRMLENLHFQKSLIASEWLLFRLGNVMGKNRALDKLHGLSAAAAQTGRSLKELVQADPETGPLITADDLDALDHPERYIGCTLEMVDNVVEEIEAKRANDPDRLYA